jgi:ACS family hexuronate transporter-like MFS transporter
MLFATLLNYMDRQALPQTATELKERYFLGDARYGLLEGWFSYAFAAGSIVFGLIADRFGPRRVYPVVLAGWSVAGLLTPLTGEAAVTGYLESPGDDPGTGAFRWLLLCRTALGFLEAGHWPCALLTARQILSAADRPLGNGLLQSGASAGAILIPLYVREVRHAGGEWGVVFWTVGAAGLLWVPVWLVLVRPGDLESVPPAPADGPSGPPGWTVVRRVLVLAVVATSLTMSWQYLRAWLPKYLKEYHHFSADAADMAVFGYFVAAEAGCLLSGAAVRYLVRCGCGVHPARVLTFAGYAALTCSAVIVPSAGAGPGMLALLMAAGAGILGLHPLYYALAQELPARWLGVMSGLLSAGAWAVAGYVQTTLGERIEATKNYGTGFLAAGLAPAVALAVIVLFWRTTGRRDDMTLSPTSGAAGKTEVDRT